MGVDITHIVRNDFYDVQNLEASKKFVFETINTLKKNLYLDEPIESFEMRVDPYIENEITFRLPLYDVEFTLHNGCWQIESYVHYCQIVMHRGPLFWLREMIYDVAEALGQSEIWHSEEFYTWNGGPMEEPSCTFEEWLSSAREKIGKAIPEYDYQAIMNQGDVHIPAYEPIYHDNLNECRRKLEDMKGSFAKFGYDPISLIDIRGFIRCKRISDGSIHLVNKETFEPLTKGTPEEYDFTFPSTLVVIKEKGKYALFDVAEAKQITKFVSEPFRKEWSRKQNDYVVINDEADIRRVF